MNRKSVIEDRALKIWHFTDREYPFGSGLTHAEGMS